MLHIGLKTMLVYSLVCIIFVCSKGFTVLRMNDQALFTDSLCERLVGFPNKSTIMAIASEAMSDAVVLNALFSYMYGSNDTLRWRAAWVVEKVSASMPMIVEGERSRIARMAMRDDTPNGLRRLLLHILYNLSDSSDLDVSLFNFLIDVMTDIHSSPGVQSLAIKFADRMSRVDADLHDEFLCILRNMELTYYSPGVNAAVRKCLTRKKR